MNSLQTLFTLAVLLSFGASATFAFLHFHTSASVIDDRLSNYHRGLSLVWSLLAAFSLVVGLSINSNW